MAGRQFVKNNLVALGSAAVLTVYSAGYARTREAAARFENESAERRPPLPRESDGIPAPVAAAVSPARVEATAPPQASTRPSPRDSAPAAKRTTAVAMAEPARRDSTPERKPTGTETSDTVAAARAVSDTAQKADSTQHADSVKSQWKDGVYWGWGTSRHGDIQASVEIKAGRITSAWISQCLTRYSCSWISALPPQVIARQSADVDFVSGATQSTNAFYSAVINALNAAK